MTKKIKLIKKKGGMFYNNLSSIHHSYIEENEKERLHPIIYIINLTKTIEESGYNHNIPIIINHYDTEYYGFIEMVKDKKIVIVLYKDPHRTIELIHLSLMARDNYPHISFVTRGMDNRPNHYHIYYQISPKGRLGWNYPIDIINKIQETRILEEDVYLNLPEGFWTRAWSELNDVTMNYFRYLLQPLKKMIEQIQVQIPFIRITKEDGEKYEDFKKRVDIMQRTLPSKGSIRRGGKIKLKKFNKEK